MAPRVVFKGGTSLSKCSARSNVVALEITRTFWEKATILHAEHHRPLTANYRNETRNLKGDARSRHFPGDPRPHAESFRVKDLS